MKKGVAQYFILAILAFVALVVAYAITPPLWAVVNAAQPVAGNDAASALMAFAPIVLMICLGYAIYVAFLGQR